MARAVCTAGCLPRKELYEAWEIGKRVRRLFRGGRIVDVGGGHGLLAQVLLLLDPLSSEALVVDPAIPPSSARVHAALVETWPRLAGRVAFVPSSFDDVDIAADDLIVSSHACGVLTDTVLDRSVAAGARVAVMPCCHDLARGPSAGDAAALAQWVDGALAIDVVRAMRLRQRGYRVWTQTIPADITPKSRVLLGAPE